VSTVREVIENAQYNLRTAFRLGLPQGGIVGTAMSQLDNVVLALDQGKGLDEEL
jgi:hypothetical protein